MRRVRLLLGMFYFSTILNSPIFAIAQSDGFDSSVGCKSYSTIRVVNLEVVTEKGMSCKTLSGDWYNFPDSGEQGYIVEEEAKKNVKEDISQTPITSSLPPCSTRKNARKHNCYGESAASGNVYIGEWKNNKASGNGSMAYRSGSKYVGKYKNGKRHGNGVYNYKDGTAYNGNWKKNKKDGIGTRTYTTGDKYSGEWGNDKYNGQGTYTFADGVTHVGNWIDGTIVGTGTYYLDGKAYKSKPEVKEAIINFDLNDPNLLGRICRYINLKPSSKEKPLHSRFVCREPSGDWLNYKITKPPMGYKIG